LESVSIRCPVALRPDWSNVSAPINSRRDRFFCVNFLAAATNLKGNGDLHFTVRAARIFRQVANLPPNLKSTASRIRSRRCANGNSARENRSTFFMVVDFALTVWS